MMKPYEGTEAYKAGYEQGLKDGQEKHNGRLMYQAGYEQGRFDEYAENVPKWIPVSERLPDKDGEYLVWYEEGYRKDYGLHEIGIIPFEVDCEGFGVWYERFDPKSLGSLGSDWEEIHVTAWMPLPPSYEQEWERERKSRP